MRSSGRSRFAGPPLNASVMASKTAHLMSTIESDIEECRARLVAGESAQEDLDILLSIKADLEDENSDIHENHALLFEHLPDDCADPVLLILKGHLLIERMVRRYIHRELSNPEAFRGNSLSAAQCIMIAEALGPHSENRARLWSLVRELNAIRNRLAHNLDIDAEKRLESFVAEVDDFADINISRLRSALGFLYGVVQGLGDTNSGGQQVKTP